MAAAAAELSHETKKMQTRILIADDQPDVLLALRLLLKGNGYTAETVSSPAELLEAVAGSEFDLVLMDLNYARDTTSGQEGLDLLAHLNAIENVPPIIVMTGWATVGLAVEAMQRGVTDFVEKPWTNSKLLASLEKQVAIGRERRALAKNAVRESQARHEMASLVHQHEREIAEARAIQEGFLPKEIPQLAGYEIASAWQSARVVGGDYFDVLSFDQGSIGICIADVAGKGLPAALLMSNLQAAVRGLASADLAPADLCMRLNLLLCRNMANDRFITFFYAQLDGAAGILRYVNAGHNPPIVMHRDGSHDRLTDGGIVLGAFPNQSFVNGSVRMQPGDRLVLYTDGVTEAANAEDEEFGDARLIQVLREHRDASAQHLQTQILATAGAFCANRWHDDATLLILAAC
ncbi:MAG: SpoIIE family protein phosphatase [Acidobacteria bacterium]|nr:SpoIIE family protein phosphatase [Acidobacteriota bacterium]